MHTGGIDALDASDDGEGSSICLYGVVVEVGSFGALAHELPRGRPLSQAATGVGVVACWGGVGAAVL